MKKHFFLTHHRSLYKVILYNQMGLFVSPVSSQVMKIKWENKFVQLNERQ